MSRRVSHPTPRAANDRSLSREQARTYLQDKIDRERRQLADPSGFSTIDPNWIIEDAEWRLRWLDCAPEGAWHVVAPLQDKAGVPMGLTRSENLGPNQALRDARIAHGRNPFSGGLA